MLWSAFTVMFISNHVYAGCEDITNEIWSGDSCTKIKTYKSTGVSDNPLLLVVLHGDSPFRNPGYQNEFAKLMASKNSNVVAVGMLRPGYMDPSGRTSDGVKGEANGDSYDKKRVNQVAQAITELKKVYSPSKVLLAGHSGGSAITANIISLYPALIDHAFVVSCPCDVKAWREDMLDLSKKPIFSGDLETLSPIELVDHLNENTKISMFVGKNDRITQSIISKHYKKAATEKGAKVTLKIIEGKHDIFLSPLILNEMTEILSSYHL